MKSSITTDNFIYCIFSDRRHIHQLDKETNKLLNKFPAPTFQPEGITFIKETDGGVMVAFSQGSIYYMNHAGEFYHLITVSPPEEEAILVSASPPITTWKTKDNQLIQVNTDEILKDQ